ncbi:MAG: TRAP transporter substrate-binding protein [Deltaproteobacteria bacterium]|nr:TRAP transporter substrate-binding protein [Deltaproteobacteria bacterium]
MMVRTLAAAALSLALLLPLGAEAQAEKPEFVFKMASIAPDGTPWSEHLDEWKKRVAKESGGRIKLKTYWGGVLGDENVTVQETHRGAIHFFAGSVAALASSVPELSVLELPYLFRSFEEVDHILDEVILEDAKKLLWERGYVLVFWHENGWRSIGTRYGPIHGPQDVKGKKMRTQEVDTHLEMYRAYGASPVPIAATEVLSSLQTGVVDGFDNTPLFSFASSWYQGVSHYSVTRHIYQPGIMVMSRKSFETLPKELQDVILKDSLAEGHKGRKMVRALSPLLLQNFEAAGIELYRPTPEELKALADAAQPVHTWFKKAKGERAAALLSKIEKALAAHRAK